VAQLVHKLFRHKLHDLDLQHVSRVSRV
jgi:hypothetical protein